MAEEPPEASDICHISAKGTLRPDSGHGVYLTFTCNHCFTYYPYGPPQTERASLLNRTFNPKLARLTRWAAVVRTSKATPSTASTPLHPQRFVEVKPKNLNLLPTALERLRQPNRNYPLLLPKLSHSVQRKYPRPSPRPLRVLLLLPPPHPPRP